MAKMIGFGAIDLTMSWVTAPLTDSPKNDVGALDQRLGQRARRGLRPRSADFHWFMPSVRPW